MPDEEKVELEFLVPSEAGEGGLDPRFQGIIDLLVTHTGMTQFQIRWSGTNEPEGDGPEHEPAPLVWLVLGYWPTSDSWRVGAHVDLTIAGYRLAEVALDGGRCLNCGNAMAFLTPWANDPALLGYPCCSVAWDEQHGKYERGCRTGARNN